MPGFSIEDPWCMDSDGEDRALPKTTAYVEMLGDGDVTRDLPPETIPDRARRGGRGKQSHRSTITNTGTIPSRTPHVSTRTGRTELGGALPPQQHGHVVITIDDDDIPIARSMGQPGSRHASQISLQTQPVETAQDVQNTSATSHRRQFSTDGAANSFLTKADDPPAQSKADRRPSATLPLIVQDLSHDAIYNAPIFSGSPAVLAEDHSSVRSFQDVGVGGPSGRDEADSSASRIGKRAVDSETILRVKASQNATNKGDGIVLEPRDGVEQSHTSKEQTNHAEGEAQIDTGEATDLTNPFTTRPTIIDTSTKPSIPCSRPQTHEVAQDSVPYDQRSRMKVCSPYREQAAPSINGHTPHINDKQVTAAYTEDAPTPSLASLPSPPLLGAGYGAEASLPVKAMGQTKSTQRAAVVSDPDEANSPITFDLLSGDIVTVRREIETLFKERLERLHQSHASTTHRNLSLQRACLTIEASQPKNLRRLRRQGTLTTLPDRYVQHQSPFKALGTIQVLAAENPRFDLKRNLSQEVFSKSNMKSAHARSIWSVPATAQSFPPTPFPPSKEYSTLSGNLLVDNISKLTTMPPDLEDQTTQKQLREDMPSLYEIRHDTNSPWDLRNAQSRFHINVVSDFLLELEISWGIILFYLLAEEADLRRINDGTFENIPIKNRECYSRDDFYREGKLIRLTLFEPGSRHWKGLVEKLRRPTVYELHLGALVCEILYQECGFSPWYMAQQSDIIKEYLRQKIKQNQPEKSSTQQEEFRTRECRVCGDHACIFHGQIKQDPESDSRDKRSSSPENGIPAHKDKSEYLNIERVINYKLLANSQNFRDYHHQVLRRKSPPVGKFDPKFWLGKTATSNRHKRKPFQPCKHEGSCITAHCRCYSEGITCEKTCRCAKSCNRRFPGCGSRCMQQPTRPCGNSETCLCVKFERECDADICGRCGAIDILDPENNKDDEDILQGRCRNVGIQRGVPKKTLLGQSEVHMFGLYTAQSIAKDDIIGEYTSEIIDADEENRRIHIYNAQNQLYLFDMNDQQSLDGTLAGNKLRYINNAHERLANCRAKTIFCNGVYRTALYTKKSLEPGTELFFHYGYPESVTKYFKQPKGSVYAVKNVVKPSDGKSATAKKSRPTKVQKTSEYPAPLKLANRSRAQRAQERASRSTSRTNSVGMTTRQGLARDTIDQERESDSSESQQENDPEAQVESDAQETASSHVVPETDEEIDSELDPSQEQDVPSGRLSTGRKEPHVATQPMGERAIKSSSVMAIKEKRRGLRNGVARKRKHQFFLNSDENQPI